MPRMAKLEALHPACSPGDRCMGEVFSSTWSGGPMCGRIQGFWTVPIVPEAPRGLVAPPVATLRTGSLPIVASPVLCAALYSMSVDAFVIQGVQDRAQPEALHGPVAPLVVTLTIGSVAHYG